MIIDISEVLNCSMCSHWFFKYLVAFIVFVVAILILRIFEKFVIHGLRRMAKKTSLSFDDVIGAMLDSIGWPLYILFSFYLSFLFIDVPNIVSKYFPTLLYIGIAFYVVKALAVLIEFIGKKAVERDAADGQVDNPGVRLLTKFLKIILWIIAFITILDSLGYNISTLATTLGIGGIAVAFALQNILSDVFASFSIYTDKPFKIGDFITIGDEMGSVKSIGIKSTRLQSLAGEELIVSNRELTESKIHNFGVLNKRRVPFKMFISHETPNAKLKKIPKMIKDIMKTIDLVEYDRAYLKEFGEYGLVYEIVFFFESPEYPKYIKAKELINLKIKGALEKEKIGFAYKWKPFNSLK
jgi:small-conductance mechanosensitive channel